MSFVRRYLNFTIILDPAPVPVTGLPTPTTTFSGTNANTVTIQGVTGSPIWATAKINRAGIYPAQLDATIFGLPISLMNQLSSLGRPVIGGSVVVGRNSIIVEAFDDNTAPAVIFTGNVTAAWGDFAGSPRVPFNIQAFEGIDAQMAPIGATSYPGPATVALIMQTLAKQIGYSFENNGVTTVLPSPYFSGTALLQIDAAARAANISYTLDNGVLAIWPGGGARGGAVPIIAPPPNGSMIGYPAYTAGGVVVKTLWDRSIVPGGKVQIKNSIVTPANGTWSVTVIDHDLDTQPNGEWSSTMKCYFPNFEPLPG